MNGIDHLDLVVTDRDRSLAFYRALLAPLGYTREGHITGERGEPVTYLNREDANGDRDDGGSLSIRQRQSEAHPVPYDRYAVGVHHVAFAARSRAVVDERAAWLRSEGVEIESGPAEYDYSPGYYAIFFYDPDHIKLEIVHAPG